MKNNKPCYAKEHWQRLSLASSFLTIPFTLTYEVWTEKLKEFIHLKKLKQGGIKALLAAGKAPRGLVECSSESWLIFSAFNFLQNIKPLKLVSANWQRDANNPIYQIKSINYLEAIMARRIAQQAGAEDVLFFNLQNHLTDTTIANFFIIKNDCLFTPSISCGVLPGIVRQRLFILCEKQGIECKEVELDKKSLSQADAAFTSNALQGIRPVQSVDEFDFNVNHPLISLLQKLLLIDQSNSC